MVSDVVNELLTALEKNPKIKARLRELLDLGEDEIVRKKELGQILEELKKQRIESNERFDKLINELASRTEALINEMRERFEQVDKRFEQVDKRFEQVDKRFEQMIKENKERFEQVDKRFEQMIKENKERFEQVDKRFEQMIKENKERFEQADKRFEQMIKENKERFEQMREESNKRFNEMMALLKEEKDERLYFEALITNDMADLSSRYGKRAEDSLRKVVAKILKAEGIDQELIDHVQLIDPKGKYFIPGYTTDIDIYYKGKNETWLIEYKARVRKDDIMKHIKVGELARDVYKMRNVVLVMVTLKISEDMKRYAEDHGIKVIVGKQANPKLLLPPSFDE